MRAQTLTRNESFLPPRPLPGSSTPMESMPVWLQYVMRSPTPRFVAFSHGGDAHHRRRLFRRRLRADSAGSSPAGEEGQVRQARLRCSHAGEFRLSTRSCPSRSAPRTGGKREKASDRPSGKRGGRVRSTHLLLCDRHSLRSSGFVRSPRFKPTPERSSLDQLPDLYLELARSKSTLAAQKLFAKKYGLLTHRVPESTSLWPGLVSKMDDLVAMVADTGAGRRGQPR